MLEHIAQTALSRVSLAGGDNIRDRFYREDAARGADGGFGPGLSIGRNLARVRHGKIWMGHETGVIPFFVSLPRVPPQHAEPPHRPQ